MLATLTEVNITHPSTYNSNLNYTDKIINDYPPKRENMQQVQQDINDSSPELDRLQNYIKIKKSKVFRVHPIILPENLNKCDYIVNQPFNVFIFKKDLPNFIKSENFKEMILCNMHKIEPPNITQESKDENNIKTSIVVRICIIDQYFNRLSKNLKPCFSEKDTSRKFPRMFIPNKLLSNFNIAIGSKVSLGNTFSFQGKVLNVELVCANKKVRNLVEKFRNYILEQVKYEKCLLNAKCCIEIEENVVCSLMFTPDNEFCLFDELMARNIKIYENTEKTVAHEKINTSEIIIDKKELYNDCDSFNKIINNINKMLCLKNSNENIFIVGKLNFILYIFHLTPVKYLNDIS